jgi:solute carrier family 25 protein 39/40
MSIPSAAIYMIGYEHLLTLLTPHLSPEPGILSDKGISTHNPSLSNVLSTVPTTAAQPYLNATPLVAGGLARTISATVISPMELFRTRLQALPAREC